MVIAYVLLMQRSACDVYTSGGFSPSFLILGESFDWSERLDRQWDKPLRIGLVDLWKMTTG
jgi:hypothetical protein